MTLHNNATTDENSISKIIELAKKSEEYFIFIINGGIGKNIAATAVVKGIHKKYPNKKIVIVTGWTEVWQNNPLVHRFYRAGGMLPYFYSDYIKDHPNTIPFAEEPYAKADYILKKKHLINIWFEMLDIPYEGETPELYFNQREVQFVENQFVKGANNIMIIQTNGGAENNMQKISWMRDMPLDLAQAMVDNFLGEYLIYHIRRPDQPELQNVTAVNLPIRQLFILIAFSKKRLLIDSFSQHAAAALKLPSTVIWVRNAPEVLGYDMHDNIVTPVQDNIDTLFASYLEPYDIMGQIDQCPFPMGTALFNFDEVLKSLNKQKNNIELPASETLTPEHPPVNLSVANENPN